MFKIHESDRLVAARLLLPLPLFSFPGAVGIRRSRDTERGDEPEAANAPVARRGTQSLADRIGNCGALERGARGFWEIENSAAAVGSVRGRDAGERIVPFLGDDVRWACGFQ